MSAAKLLIDLELPEPPPLPILLFLGRPRSGLTRDHEADRPLAPDFTA